MATQKGQEKKVKERERLGEGGPRQVMNSSLDDNKMSTNFSPSAVCLKSLRGLEKSILLSPLVVSSCLSI